MSTVDTEVESRLTRLETQQVTLIGFAGRIEGKLDSLSNVFVSHVEFWPVKAIVYTGAGAVMLSVLAAVIGMVIIAAK